MADIDLSVNFAGVRISSPVWVAAISPISKAHKWTPDEFAKMLAKFAELGAGAVHLPTWVYDRRTKDGGGRFMRHEAARGLGWDAIFWVSNSMKQVMYTREEVYAMLRAVKNEMKGKPHENCPVVGSILCETTDPEVWSKTAREFEEKGIDMLELNLGCSIVLRAPDESKQVYALYQMPELMEKVVKAVRETISIPLMVKIGAELPFPQGIINAGKAILRAGCKAISAIGGYPVIWPPDIYAGGRPKGLKFVKGDKITFSTGIGPFTRIVMNKFALTFALYLPEIDFCGRGGFLDPEHVVEFIMLGGKVAGFASGLLWRGYVIIPQTISFLKNYMEEQGYSSIEDFRGSYLKYFTEYADEIEFLPAVSKVDESLCNGCGICARNLCGAITLEGHVARVDEEKCGGCGICETVCPQGAIKLKLKE